MTATPPSPSSTLKRLHCARFTGGQDRFLSTALGEHRDPVLDQIRCFCMDLHPRQAVAKDAAMRQRTLRSDAGTEITKAPLKAQNLSQSLDIAARQRKRGHSGSRRASSA
jgi:hypothetical protein